MTADTLLPYREPMTLIHSTVGRRVMLAECPCCGRDIVVHAWSLAGSGKRCRCGAKLLTHGAIPAKDDPGPWGAGAMYV